MQENGNLIAPMVKARDDLQRDIDHLLSLVNQRRKALKTLEDAIDTMRSLPESVVSQSPSRSKRPDRKPKSRISGQKLLTNPEAVIHAAIALSDHVFTSQDILNHLNIPFTSGRGHRVNKILKNSDLFERIGPRVGLAHYRAVGALQHVNEQRPTAL